MKQTSLFFKIRRLALCLILGGLLLLTFVGCQGEMFFSQRADAAFYQGTVVIRHDIPLTVDEFSVSSMGNAVDPSVGVVEGHLEGLAVFQVKDK